MSNALAALGGIASGLSTGLQHKRDQERAEEDKHQDFINQLVVNGITSGKVSDPEQAFKFLMNNGKPGGKDLPPAISTMLGSVMQHSKNQQASAAPTPTTPTTPPLPVQPGQPYNPSSDPNASRYSVTGLVSGQPQTPPPAPASAPGTGGGTGGGEASTGTPGASSILSGAPSPANPPVPGRSLNPMGGWKTADELSNEEVARRGRDVEATAQTNLNVKIATAKRMFATGAARSLQEAYELVGLRKPTASNQRLVKGADHIPAWSVQPGALDTNGQPFDPTATGAEWVQSFNVLTTGPDGVPAWETRYEPGSPPAGVATVEAKGNAPAKPPSDPAAFRKYYASIQATNPGMPDAEIRRQAGQKILNDATTASELARTRADSAAESAGTKAGPYDDLPIVTQRADGRPDPDEQAAFMAQLRAKPKGGLLGTNVQQIVAYKMPLTTFTSRQIGGLNREVVTAMARQYDPTFDETKYRPRQEMLNSWRGDGKVAQQMQTARKIVNHLADFSKANAAMDKVEWNAFGGSLNQIVTEVQRLGLAGDKRGIAAQKALKEYETTQNAVAHELRNFYAPGGSGSVEEVNKWLALSNPYGTATERRAFINAGAHLMIGQVVPKVEAYQEVLGDLPPGSLWLTNNDRLRLRGMGVDTSDLPNLPENENKGTKIDESKLPPEVQGLPPGGKITDKLTGQIWYRGMDGTLRGGTTTGVQPPK